MKLAISPEIVNTFPGLRIAVLVVKGIDNKGTDTDLQARKVEAANRMYKEYTYERLAERSEIEAWREAYRKFGAKPKESRPTAEAFLRRLIKGDDFPTISKAVDSYLLVETEYFLPVGGYDLSHVTGDIHLRLSAGDEPFVPIGATREEVTRSGEVIYADDARVLTRKWNFRDCDECKITDESRDIALFTEAPFPEIDSSKLKASIEQMAQLITSYCGGTATTKFLDTADSSELELL